MNPRSELDLLWLTVDEVREKTHQLGALQLTAVLPTFDGEATIDYRPQDWLKISVLGRQYVLPPDWSA